jgi:hypothetical protein
LLITLLWTWAHKYLFETLLSDILGIYRDVKFLDDSAFTFLRSHHILTSLSIWYCRVECSVYVPVIVELFLPSIVSSSFLYFNCLILGGLMFTLVISSFYIELLIIQCSCSFPLSFMLLVFFYPNVLFCLGIATLTLFCLLCVWNVFFSPFIFQSISIFRAKDCTSALLSAWKTDC